MNKPEPCKCGNAKLTITTETFFNGKEFCNMVKHFISCPVCGRNMAGEFSKQKAIDFWNINLLLKPCPRCGSGNARMHQPFENFFAHCNECKQSGRSTKYVEKAISHWNKLIIKKRGEKNENYTK